MEGLSPLTEAKIPKEMLIRTKISSTLLRHGLSLTDVAQIQQNFSTKTKGHPHIHFHLYGRAVQL